MFKIQYGILYMLTRFIPVSGKNLSSDRKESNTEKDLPVLSPFYWVHGNLFKVNITLQRQVENLNPLRYSVEV